MTTTTMIENRWYGVVGQFTRGIAHTAASYYYGVNGPQAAHTWEPAGSKPGSLIGREPGIPALWLVETRLCHSHHPRVHSAHTPSRQDCLIAKPVWHSFKFHRNPDADNALDDWCYPFHQCQSVQFGCLFIQHQIQHEAGNLDYGWLVDDDIKEMAVVIHNEIPFVIEGLGEVYEQRRQLFMTSSAGTGLQSERVLAEVVHT